MYIEIDLVNIAKKRCYLIYSTFFIYNKNALFLHIVITYIIRYEKFANIFKGTIS